MKSFTAADGTEFRPVALTTAGESALRAARVWHGLLPTVDHRVTTKLERDGLIVADGPAWRWTTLGRLQVQWFADECAAYWGVSTSTWNKYVGRGTAPRPDYPGIQKSTVDRAWWDAQTVIKYVRPGSQAGPESQRVQLDNSEVLRVWRAGQKLDPPMSLAALAARFSISPTTAAALLERLGEKAPTSASLRAGNGPSPRAGMKRVMT